MDKVFVVKGVATKLWASEDAVDTAIESVASLMGGLVEARRQIGAAAGVTNATNAKLVAAMNALNEARSALVDAHEELAEVKLRIGVRTKMEGPVKIHDGNRRSDEVANTVTMVAV